MEDPELLNEFQKRRWDHLFPSPEDSTAIRLSKKQKLLNALEVKSIQLKLVEDSRPKQENKPPIDTIKRAHFHHILAEDATDAFKTPPSQRFNAVNNLSSANKSTDNDSIGPKAAAVTAQGLRCANTSSNDKNSHLRDIHNDQLDRGEKPLLQHTSKAHKHQENAIQNIDNDPTTQTTTTKILNDTNEEQQQQQQPQWRQVHRQPVTTTVPRPPSRLQNTSTAVDPGQYIDPMETPLNSAYTTTNNNQLLRTHIPRHFHLNTTTHIAESIPPTPAHRPIDKTPAHASHAINTKSAILNILNSKHQNHHQQQQQHNIAHQQGYTRALGQQPPLYDIEALNTQHTPPLHIAITSTAMKTNGKIMNNKKNSNDDDYDDSCAQDIDVPPPYTSKVCAVSGTALANDIHGHFLEGIFSPFTEFAEELRVEEAKKEGMHMSKSGLDNNNIPFETPLVDTKNHATRSHSSSGRRKKETFIEKKTSTLHRNFIETIGAAGVIGDGTDPPITTPVHMLLPHNSGIHLHTSSAHHRPHTHPHPRQPSSTPCQPTIDSQTQRHPHTLNRIQHRLFPPGESTSGMRAGGGAHDGRLFNDDAPHTVNRSSMLSSAKKKTRFCPPPDPGMPLSVQLQLPQPALLSVWSEDGKFVAVVLGSHADRQPSEIVILEVDFDPATRPFNGGNNTTTTTNINTSNNNDTNNNADYAATKKNSSIENDTKSTSPAQMMANTVQIRTCIAVQRSQHIDPAIPITSSSLAIISYPEDANTKNPMLILSALYEVPDGPDPSGCPAMHAVPCIAHDSTGHTSASSALVIENDTAFFSIFPLSPRSLLVSGDGSGAQIIEFDALWRSYAWKRKLPPAQFHAMDLIDIYRWVPFTTVVSNNGENKGGDAENKEGKCSSSSSATTMMLGISSDGMVALWNYTERKFITATAHITYAVHDVVHVPGMSFDGDDGDAAFFVGLVQHRDGGGMLAVPIIVSSKTSLAIGTPLSLSHLNLDVHSSSNDDNAITTADGNKRQADVKKKKEEHIDITAIAMLHTTTTKNNPNKDINDPMNYGDILVLGTALGTVSGWNITSGECVLKDKVVNVGHGCAITSITAVTTSSAQGENSTGENSIGGGDGEGNARASNMLAITSIDGGCALLDVDQFIST